MRMLQWDDVWELPGDILVKNKRQSVPVIG